MSAVSNKGSSRASTKLSSKASGKASGKISRLCKDKFKALRNRSVKYNRISSSLKKQKNHKKLRADMTSVKKKLELANSKRKFEEKKQPDNDKMACDATKNGLKEIKLLEKKLEQCLLNQPKPVKQPKYESLFTSFDFKLKEHEILEDLIAIKRAILSVQ